MEIERVEPEDFVEHYELLRMKINFILPLLERVAAFPCCYCVETATCVFCDTKKLLEDLKNKEK